MARKPRQYGYTGFYHIILRGNNQENLFYDSADRSFFLNKLEKYIKQLNIELYSYCLMGNHVHLLIGNGTETMSLFIKKLACSYAYFFNHKYNRTGHLFQGRYISEPVDEINYFKTVYRYILLNPEKAGICSYKNYKWSSFPCIASNFSFLNNQFMIDVFNTLPELYNFLDLHNNDICMEHFYQKKSNDDDLKIQFINNLYGIKSPLEIMKFEKNIQMKVLQELKDFGFSVNQISRLTSINKNIIYKS